ncbi:MAG: TetR/AcrR family transcriptional regulator [Lentisphaeria bacterium]|nr:TetR/AcrR family transcriptional regulator [Victivallales bacterium]MBR6060311.1 TetR/AcrR family transcriptional regulator [Victivallales bacterium]MCR4575171.1 TetR/AcrR family transcriptional regulator [Lentisphaeria bacterium]
MINHEKRREEILKKSLKLITERGYENVTYQQIADFTGLGRTTVYKYFKNKREIFDKALKMLVEEIGVDFQNGVRDFPNLSVVEKIRLIMTQLIDMMFKSPQLMQTVVEYLIKLRRSSEPTSKRVRLHTIGFYRVLMRLVREGINNGELRRMDCLMATEELYALLETATLRITLMESVERQQLIDMCDFALDGMKAVQDEE